MLWLALATLIQLHGPDGQLIYLNSAEVTNFRTPRGVDAGHFIRGTNCLVFLTSGQHLSVRETCAQIQNLLNDRLID